ncbi:hypothetical protein [Massilia sp. erpn]|uniref:hypothetical protein n=1 Tax=Massilia sp. erpn TaxID=2738142 RepID=UPI0021079FDA|nr:hypothetical protein [Massilia sp. erpn]UTY57190.1 leucine-rich repeat domain-containing protein [Massilia sp. erpn]
MKFNRHVSPIENDVQDRTSDAWKALCRYIDELEASEAEEFSPLKALGPELYAGIFTLPESIGKLKRVTKIHLYGSKLKRIPPEIGEMTALTHFDVYTSYGLQWFPYELTRCENLVQSRVSIRVLYGNYKNRLHFPWLKGNPVSYHGNTVKCSVCGCEISYDKTWQLWISLKVGTDVLPLLVNSCSKQCTDSLPTPHPNYVQHAHRGGTSIEQPSDSDEMTVTAMSQRQERPENAAATSYVSKQTESQKLPLLKVIWKIWKK